MDAPSPQAATESPMDKPSPKAKSKVSKPALVTSGLQDMLDQARNQRQAEILATRLALLKQQEDRVITETEQTRMRMNHLAMRKEQQEQRIRDKKEALGKLHREDAFYADHSKGHKAAEHTEGRGPLDMIAGVTSQQPLDGENASPSHPSASPVKPATPLQGTAAQSFYNTPPAAMSQSFHSVASAKASQSPAVAGSRKNSLAATHSGWMTPRKSGSQITPRIILSSRLHTSDVCDLAHAQTILRNHHAANRRSPAVLGAYAGEGEQRIWMPPREAAKPAADPFDVAIPDKLAKMNPKDLINKLAKKEEELKVRLENARRAQLAADAELDAKFKDFTSLQVSARRAFRDGDY